MRMSNRIQVSIENIGSVKTGPFGAQLHQSDYVKYSGTPIVTVEHLSERGLNHKNLPLVSDADKNRLKQYVLSTNDIVFSRVGSVDRCSIVSEKENGWLFSGRLLRIRPQTDQVYSPYLVLLFQTEKFKHYMRSIAVGGTMPSLNTQILSKVKISLPPLLEQKALADILQTWDTAIEKTGALIAAKEKQFDWFAKLLMSPIKNGWSTAQLNYITRIKKGQQINRDTLDATGDYPVWNGGITPSGYTERYNMNENTITISEGGNSCGFVNISTEKFWLGGHCYALEELNDSIILDFLYFYLKSRERRIMRLRVGSGLPNIQRGDIEKLEIRYPDLREQKRIAETLNTARQEIDIINTLVEQYRTQKRGLMQKLLTGNWRVGL